MSRALALLYFHTLATPMSSCVVNEDSLRACQLSLLKLKRSIENPTTSAQTSPILNCPTCTSCPDYGSLPSNLSPTDLSSLELCVSKMDKKIKADKKAEWEKQYGSNFNWDTQPTQRPAQQPPSDNSTYIIIAIALFVFIAITSIITILVLRKVSNKASILYNNIPNNTPS